MFEVGLLWTDGDFKINEQKGLQTDINVDLE